MNAMLAFMMLCSLYAAQALPLRSQAVESNDIEIPSDPGFTRLLRHSRKVSDLDTSSGPLEYMQELHDSLTYPNGKPINIDNGQTSIWCILDRDILHQNYRNKPRGQKCTNVAQFVFSWQSLAELKPLPLQKAILRTHLEVIPRLVPEDGSVEVTATVTARMFNNNGSTQSESVLAGPEQQISVTRTSNQWVELNVTEGLQSLWPSKGSSGVELTVTLTVDCKHTKKVPANFVDPTGIPLEQPKRRERYLPLQPMLLVYLEDEEIMKRIKQDEAPVVPEKDVMENTNRTEGHVKKRHGGICRVERFHVNFWDIKLYHVLAPDSYNAGKCVGSCTHTDLKRNPYVGTNHAKIMASAHLIESLEEDVIFPDTPKEPCCVPIRYSAMTTLEMTEEGLVSLTYPSMTVEDCGCR